MDRREFIKTGMAAGVTIGLTASPFKRIVAAPVAGSIVVVEGGSPCTRFIRGIDYLGGIKSLVKKGHRVVIKPSMVYDKTPESGMATDPILVRDIIRLCYGAGARVVSVFEHTIDPWTKCYKNSGIERVAKDARARVLPANHEMFYSEVKSDSAKILKSVKIHNALLEADILINLPACYFSNKSQLVGGAMSNLLGCVWDQSIFRGNDFGQCLAELLYFIKPDINIADSRLLKFGGGAQVLSADIVATDTIVSGILAPGTPLAGYLKIAGALGLGSSGVNLSDAKIFRL